VARGVIGLDGSNGYHKDTQRIISEAITNASPTERQDMSLLRERIRLDVKRFLQKQTGAKPVITPVLVQV
jgi:ribonuclease J